MQTTDPHGGLDELWAWYKQSGDRGARDRLVLQYSPLVKYVAGRVRAGLPSSVDAADLVSDGVIGLMDAIDKFDLGRGLQFQTYAVPRIRGAIVDGLRRSDWVPRSVRQKARQVAGAQAELEQRLGRPPTDREVAAELGITVKELRAAYSSMAHTDLASIDELELRGQQGEPSVAGDPDDSSGELPEEFVAAIHHLPERDRVVMALYYWENFTLSEIGQVLGVSESRVSQLHSRAVVTMRRHLGASVA